jgi:3-isopropylmalate/(R)-2-methylmalate dehydratase small subunit
MEKTIKGKAFVLGDNIDTDQIIPAEHLVYSMNDPKEAQLYGRYALSGVPLKEAGLPKGNIPFIKGEEVTSDYSIVIGGSNFGCGSSREHAPYALMKAGVKTVIAESYARIYYRNSVDGGFVIPYEAKQKLNNVISTNDELEIKLDENKLINHTTKKEYSLNPLGDILPILEAGNVFEYARKSGMIA